MNKFLSRLMPILLSFLLLPLASVALADAAAGEEKSQPCIACHGVAGDKPIANYPILAGQKRKYLLHVLRAYKSGNRTNAIMKAQTQPFSDQDLQDLAAYFAAQPGKLR